MPMESALDAELGLDTSRRTWDRLGMHRGHWQRHAAPRRHSAGASARLVPLLLAAVAASVLASLACRLPQAASGAGGQSGDEGRKATPWLGTGGVSAVASP
jgi:hypothetical protein